MSVFDLFRGFFGVPGGHYHGQRDPFFDVMTHDEDDDEDDDEESFGHDGFWRDQRDPFDSDLRFGFSFGPDGMRFQEPPIFGQVLREMEEMFTQLGRLDAPPWSEHFGPPSLASPRDRPAGGRDESSVTSLRDLMLKTPDGGPRGPQSPSSSGPRGDGGPLYESPHLPASPFHGWKPFSKFGDDLRRPQDEPKEDRDLDSAVSSGGLDQIFSPPPPPPSQPQQPRSHSFFQSVTVSKVVKPDGTVEERRTVRDGNGNEETTVTRSGVSGTPEDTDPRGGPVAPGGRPPFSDMRDDESLFSKFFGRFK